MKAFKKFAPVIAALLGVVAIVMLFLPAVVLSEDVSYNGWQVMFGYTETNKVFGSEMKTEVLAFSFMNLLSLILVAVGVVLSVLTFLGKGNKFFALIAAACFIVAAVFFFLTLTFATAGKGLTLDGTLAQEKIKEGWKLGAGPIIAAICSILAAGTAVAPALLKK